MASGVLLIAKREFVERGRSRVFVGVLLGSMILILVGLFAVSLVDRPSGTTASVAVAGDYPATLPDEVASAAASLGVDLTVVVLAGPAEAAAAVRDGEVDAALVDGHTIVARGNPPAGVDAALRQAATASARADVAGRLGLTEEQVGDVLAPVRIEAQDVSPAPAVTPRDPAELARGAAAFASVVVLFILVMAFGQFVGSAVVEEKQSRVAELVLAKVSTAAMLVGKVLGIGGLGLVQLVILGLTYLFGLQVFGQGSRAVEVFRLGLWSLTWLALWFVVGYLMYSFVFATMGATVSRLEDLQSLAYAPSVLLLPAYVVAGASLTGAPSPLLAPMSMLPWWSPLLMPFRMVTGDAAPWEVLVALVGSAGFIVLLVWFGARVYRGAALRVGGRVTFRDAYRAG